MAIHLQNIYLGFVGFTVPFAFAMGALITKQLGDTGSNSAPVDDDRVGLPGHRNHHGRKPGLSRIGWGGFWAWILWRTRRDAVADRYGLPAFVMVQERRECSGLEHRTGRDDVRHVRLRHVPDSKRNHQFGSRIRAVEYRRLFPGLPDGCARPAGYLLYDRRSYLKADNQMESLFRAKQLPLQ
jgi:hypothetical protein